MHECSKAVARRLHDARFATRWFVGDGIDVGAGGGVELPFGGVAHSGYGREKGFEALAGFTTLKTVVLHHN